MSNLIETIKMIPGVKSVNMHAATGRTYINLAGNGGSYAGERTSKLYIDQDGKVVLERGKGTTSRAWDEQKNAVLEASEAQN